MSSFSSSVRPSYTPRPPPKAYLAEHHVDSRLPPPNNKKNNAAKLKQLEACPEEANMSPRERLLWEENRKLHALVSVCYDELRKVNEMIESEERMKGEQEGYDEERVHGSRPVFNTLDTVPKYVGRNSIG